MQVTPLKTRRVEANALSLTELLDESFTELSEGSIVVITSKIVSLCEGSVVPQSETTKDELVAREATKYLGREHSMFGLMFTVTNATLIPTAGIDESNGNGYFVLWPRDPWETAREVRVYLAQKFGLERLGVILTDSTCTPLRRGTSGIAISHAGFHAAKNYVGQPDLFGDIYKVTYANISGMLAAAAVATMGEGTEQTPLALITDVPFVDFNAVAPDTEELEFLRISAEEDLFAPFLGSVTWLPGQDAATPKSND